MNLDVLIQMLGHLLSRAWSALAPILRFALPLFKSEAFWLAVGAIGTVTTLLVIYKQVSNARNVAAYEFLRKEDDRFSGDEMEQKRASLALILLSEPEEYEEIDKHADSVLSYFEDLGLMARKRIAPEYFIWSMNSYYVLRYWSLLSKYIRWVRTTKDDPTYYEEFEDLHKRILRQERKRTKRKLLNLTPKELRRFLGEELHINIRLFTLDDLNRVMEIEHASFTVDAYTKEDFKKLHDHHPGEFFVAESCREVFGYIAGSISDDVGEIDSIGVDPRFRGAGIGRKLTQVLLERFRKSGVRKWLLEVRITNDDAIGLYKGFGFRIVSTLDGYYADGADAYLMEKTVGALN